MNGIKDNFPFVGIDGETNKSKFVEVKMIARCMKKVKWEKIKD